MRIIKNINSATACALYNKGVKTLCAALDSLTKGDRKKMENYLVIPNNCVLSLSLSLSLSSTSVNKSLFLSLVRAWYAVQTHVGKELIASFLCLICMLCKSV